MKSTSYSWKRLIVLSIGLLLVMIAIIILIFFSNWFNSFLLIIFAVLGISIALFMWLLPLAPVEVSQPEQSKGLPISLSNPSSTKHDLADTTLVSPTINITFTDKHTIKDEVKSVVEEVERAQNNIISQNEWEIAKEVSDEIIDILHVASVNSRAALLLLSANIESHMRSRLQEAGLQPNTNYALSNKAIKKAEEEGLIPGTTISAFHDFIAVRNKVAHGVAFDVDDATILSLVSIGIELLKIISARKQEDTEVHDRE